MGKALIAEQGDVFAEFVGDQYIFEGFSFLGDLHLAVFISSFIIVVVPDEIPVVAAVFG